MTNRRIETDQIRIRLSVATDVAADAPATLWGSAKTLENSRVSLTVSVNGDSDSPPKPTICKDTVTECSSFPMNMWCYTKYGL